MTGPHDNLLPLLDGVSGVAADDWAKACSENDALRHRVLHAAGYLLRAALQDRFPSGGTGEPPLEDRPACQELLSRLQQFFDRCEQLSPPEPITERVLPRSLPAEMASSQDLFYYLQFEGTQPGPLEVGLQDLVETFQTRHRNTNFPPADKRLQNLDGCQWLVEEVFPPGQAARLPKRVLLMEPSGRFTALFACIFLRKGLPRRFETDQLRLVHPNTVTLFTLAVWDFVCSHLLEGEEGRTGGARWRAGFATSSPLSAGLGVRIVEKTSPSIQNPSATDEIACPPFSLDWGVIASADAGAQTYETLGAIYDRMGLPRDTIRHCRGKRIVSPCPRP